ncbi:T9SS type A sorting domain-containing protein [bacterium SCSIO 12741]|nr:T9SS type A sorting domain-containing protein [bacterium SCSIO 12741]
MNSFLSELHSHKIVELLPLNIDPFLNQTIYKMNKFTAHFMALFFLLMTTSVYSQTNTYKLRISSPNAVLKVVRSKCSNNGNSYRITNSNFVGKWHTFPSSCFAGLTETFNHTYRFNYPGVKNSDITSMTLIYWAKMPSGYHFQTAVRVHIPISNVFGGTTSQAFALAHISPGETHTPIGTIQGTNLPQYHTAPKGMGVPRSSYNKRPNDSYVDISFCAQSGDFIELERVELEINVRSANLPDYCDDVWRIENLPKQNIVPNSAKNNSIAVGSNDEVFYVETDHTLKRVEKTASGYKLYDMSSIAGNVGGELAANNSGKVFYRKTDNSMGVVYKSAGTWHYADLSSVSGFDVAGGLTIRSTGEVFYRTTNNSISCLYYQNGAWHKHSFSNLIPNNVGGNPTAGPTGKVFFRSNVGDLECLYMHNGTWLKHTFSNIVPGNVSGGAPAITPDGRVFYQTTDNSIDCIYYENGQWHRNRFNHLVPHNVRPGDCQLQCNASGQIFFVTNYSGLECLYKDANNGWHKAVFWYGALHSVDAQGGLAAGHGNGEIFYIGKHGKLYRHFYGTHRFCKSIGSKKSDVASEAVGIGDQPVIPNVKIEVAPNPSSGIFKLKVPNESTVDFSIRDIRGRVIHKGQEMNATEIRIDLTDQIEGLYLLQVTYEGHQETLKLIKR